MARVLGISAFYHDSAAALLVDGEIVAAAQEERFTRNKHDRRFPHQAIDFCLTQGELTANDVDYVAFYDKPFLKFERLLETYLAFAPRGFKSFRMSMPLWLKEKLFQKSLLTRRLKDQLGADFDGAKLLFAEHHQSHAASAFFPSPFNEAVVLTMDGVGEWATTSAAIGRGNSLEMIKEIHFPHSLGLLYSAFTYYTGFKVNSGEYKVMGLAPYGRPIYADRIKEHLIDLKDDGSFRLNMEYFDFCTGDRSTNAKFDQLFGGPPRTPEQLLTQREMDLAASVQVVIEEAVIKLAGGLRKETGIGNLCLAGGVALNCVANGKLLREGIFDEIWVQPAAGDAGGALGAALTAHHLYNGHRRTPLDGRRDRMSGAYLGPAFTQEEIQRDLIAAGARFVVLGEEAMLEATAEALAEGRAVGWFNGRMEFGPRALGARSILGDPRSPETQTVLNLKVKYRESFRPFAPSVLDRHVSDWFEHEGVSPYMLMVAPIRTEKQIPMTEAQRSLFGIDKLKVPRSEIPAVTHIDYSARLQTVHEETNPLYFRLITKFHEKTGCPVVVNTSFNVRGEPIVCTPVDAFRCFMGTELDLLVIGRCVLRKTEQDEALKRDYKNAFELD